MKKYWMLLLLVPLIINGCGVFRKMDQSIRTDKKPDMQSPLGQAHKSAAHFSHLSFNANIVYVADGNENSLSANFRIKKDSLIWVSVRKMGFEGARLMLSKDSVWVMDRINSRYFAGTYSFFRQQFRLDADYNMVEALLLGNPLENWSDQPMDIDCSKPNLCKVMFTERYRINQPEGQPEGSTVTVQWMEISKLHGRLLSNYIADDGRNITAIYDHYKSVKDISLPSYCKLVIEYDGKSQAITLTPENYKVDESATFPFKIPVHYKLMETKE